MTTLHEVRVHMQISKCLNLSRLPYYDEPHRFITFYGFLLATGRQRGTFNYLQMFFLLATFDMLNAKTSELISDPADNRKD